MTMPSIGTQSGKHKIWKSLHYAPVSDCKEGFTCDLCSWTTIMDHWGSLTSFYTQEEFPLCTSKWLQKVVHTHVTWLHAWKLVVDVHLWFLIWKSLFAISLQVVAPRGSHMWLAGNALWKPTCVSWLGRHCITYLQAIAERGSHCSCWLEFSRGGALVLLDSYMLHAHNSTMRVETL